MHDEGGTYGYGLVKGPFKAIRNKEGSAFNEIWPR